MELNAISMVLGFLLGLLFPGIYDFTHAIFFYLDPSKPWRKQKKGFEASLEARLAGLKEAKRLQKRITHAVEVAERLNSKCRASDDPRECLRHLARIKRVQKIVGRYKEEAERLIRENA